jgi:hypothetical protein
LVPGPSGACGWDSHHWIRDRWDQTICAACNSKIEPIPGPNVDVERLKKAHRNLFEKSGQGLFGGYVEALAAEYNRLSEPT